VIGWLDVHAGASGDMWLGALVDSGVPLELLQDQLDRLHLGIGLEQRTVERGGIGAVKVDVTAPDSTHHRRWADIRELLDRLDDPVRGTANEVFRRLAEAEAAVHRIDPEDVHFHEVGALDAIADVVAAVTGLHHLRLDRLHCSTVSLGSSTTRGAHGPLPIPAPAVVRLLAGSPVTAGQSPYESTTPTGAALLAEVVTDWGPLPTMTVDRVGYGAGNRNLAEVANVLRLAVGNPIVPAPARPTAAAARDERRRSRSKAVAAHHRPPPGRWSLRRMADPDPDEEGPTRTHPVGAVPLGSGRRGPRCRVPGNKHHRPARVAGRKARTATNRIGNRRRGPADQDQTRLARRPGGSGSGEQQPGVG
jgi:uncharacterized protein (DUF111 family)